MSQYAPFLLPMALLYGYLLAAALLVFALRPGPGVRVGRFLLVPVAASIALAAILLLAATEPSAALPGVVLRGGLVAGGIYGLDPVWTIPIAVVALLSALVTAHYVVEVLPGIVTWIVSRARRTLGRAAVADVTRSAVMAILIGGIAAGTVYLQSVLVPGGGGPLTQLASFDLGGSPTSITMVDERRGYMAYGEGSIVRFELSADDSSIDIREVATGLSFPRGLAVAEDRLFVIDLGDLPCDEPFPQCWFSEPEQELEVLNATSASVLAYPINADGSLGAPTTVLDDLPVVSTEHAPNDIEPGRDGMLYLSIGNVDRLPLEPSLLDAIDRPNDDLLGTIIRFAPDGSDVSVYTRGIRNIYELAADPEGNLYGVDNDGRAIRGWRAEALIELNDGEDWGFPRYGTYDAGLDPEARPIWTLHLSGSAGLSWIDELDDRSGLLVGGFGTIAFIGLERDDVGPIVIDEIDVDVAIEGLQGFVPSIETLPDGRVLAAVFAPFSGYRNTLLVLSAGP